MLFSQLHYFELGPKKLELSYFPPSYAIFPPSYAIFFFFPLVTLFFPPVTLFSSFSPQLRYLLCFRGKSSVTGGKNTKIAQDIYYIKQTPSYAIFPPSYAIFSP